MSTVISRISKFRLAACAVGLWATAACESVTVNDCDIKCDLHEECPSDFTCVKGYCVHPNSTAMCVAAADGVGGTTGGSGGGTVDPTILGAAGGSAEAGGTGATGGTGGTASAGGSGAASGTAGVGELGGTAAVGGSGAAGGGAGAGAGAGGEGGSPVGDCSAPRALSIAQPSPARGCTARPASVALNALGGVPPYTWSVAQNSAGFSLSASDGDAVQLVGTPGSATTEALDISLEDACKQTTTLHVTLDVRDPPVATASPLPEGCMGARYSWPFTVTGGDPASYQLTTDLPDTLGLSFAGQTLSGQLNDSGSFTFHVSVGDDFCAPSAGASDPFNFVVQGVGSCPVLPLDQQNVPALAPPPACRGSQYTAGFLAPSNGLKQPLSWSVSDLPMGFSKFVTSKTNALRISGIPNAGFAFTVQVTDSNARTVVLSYDLAPRDKCWLAFTSTDAGLARLYLVDPWLANEFGFPTATSTSDAVADFAFSPDGQYLAYRLVGGANSQLVLLHSPAWQEQPLSFAGPVTSYQWAPNSKLLAVSFQGPGGTQLGGIDLSQPNSPIALTPTSTPIVAAPIWFAGAAAKVAFQTAPVRGTSSVGFSTFDPTAEAFAAFTSVGVSYLTPQIKSGTSGFFVLDPPTKIDFYSPQTNLPTQAPTAFRHGFEQLSPSGNFTASASNGELKVFSAETNSAGSGTPLTTATGCGSLLTWAAGRERIACVSDTGNAVAPGQISIFDVDSKNALSSGTIVAGVSSYTVSLSLNHRRAFSPSGDWLALVTASAFYVVDLRQGNFNIYKQYPVSLAATDNTEISFSSDEQFVLLQHGPNLTAFGLADPGVDYSANQKPIVQQNPCLEGASTTPDDWCGRASPRNALQWSPNSPLAVYPTPSGGLEVENLRDETNPPIAHAIDCLNCMSMFGFQP